MEVRLASRDAYAELLVALRGFYRLVEVALVTVAGWERLGALAQVLGCLYALDGSALGGRIVARRPRQALGEEAPRR